MKVERGEGGALVFRWNRASVMTVAVAVSVAIVMLLLALVLTEIGDFGVGAALMLWGVAAVAAAAVIVTRATMMTTWRVGNGAIVREGTWLRSERRWQVDREAEVALIHRVTSGRNAHEKWGVVVRSGGEEIVLDEKSNAEAEARRVGEALARELRAPMRYGPGGIAIRAEDLDLPFVERVAKYPGLRAEPRPRPDGVAIREDVLGSNRVFRWRALNPFTLLAVLGVAVFTLVYVAADSPAAVRFLVGHPAWIAGCLGVPVALLAGVEFHLSAGPQGVGYRVTMYGLPVRTRGIASADLEEVRVRKVVHTPALQMASDRQIILCRLYRWKSDDVLEWLAGEVQQALGGSPGSRFPA